MSPLESMMRVWLETGTPTQKEHAAYRLSLPFSDEAPPTRPPVRLTPWPACESRERCGCQWPKCLDPERGPAFGRAETLLHADGTTTTLYRVTAESCARCVSAPPAPRYDGDVPI